MSKALIRYWSAKVRYQGWYMGKEDLEMIQETIRVLKDTDRKEKMTRVDREIEQIKEAKRAK